MRGGHGRRGAARAAAGAVAAHRGRALQLPRDRRQPGEAAAEEEAGR